MTAPTLHEASLSALDGLSGVDALCALILEDDRPLSGAAGFLDWRLCGAFSRVLAQGFFTGAAGEKLLMPTSGGLAAQRVFAVGLGKSASVTQLGLEHALTSLVAVLEKAKAGSVALLLPELPKVDDTTAAAVTRRAFTGLLQGKSVHVIGSAELKRRW